MDDDAAADPQHRRRADAAEPAQQYRHARHQPAPQRADHCRTMRPRQRNAGVVGLHDQRHRAIDETGDADADDRQHHRALDDRLRRDGRQRDCHDLGRQDQIGPDRAGDLLVFERLRIDRGLAGVAMRVMPGDQFLELLGAFEAQVQPARHQQRRDRPGCRPAEQQRARQQVQQLVSERSEGDLADDRQLAIGGKAGDVARGDGGIVDDDTHGLRPGLCRLRRRVVE